MLIENISIFLGISIPYHNFIHNSGVLGCLYVFQLKLEEAYEESGFTRAFRVRCSCGF